MSRNGSGTYTLPAGNPVVTGTTIASTWANNTLSDIASTLTDSVAADGQTAMTGNLNLNSNKIVNLATPTLSTDAVTKAYVDTADALSLLKASNLSDVANATTSRTNLSAAKSGANTDITSLTGLTTPLSVVQGGTGDSSITSNSVILGNGSSALSGNLVAPSTSGNVLTSNGTTWTSVAGSYPLTSGTAVASTSGTSIDFTSIPSWVKRITVMFNGVSTNGSSLLQVQIGAGSVTTTGYIGSVNKANAGANFAFTDGFLILATNNSSWATYGHLVLTNISSNSWVESSNVSTAQAGSDGNQIGAGVLALSGTLDRVRITTVNGTDTFDAGSINILYE
jgi:hypothetical protein